MNRVVPAKLQHGDEVRVIAPSNSLAMISPHIRARATAALERLGLKVTFGKYVEEQDEYGSSSIKSRLLDLHQAFEDKRVKAIFSVIGGHNSNQLLPYIDWRLVRENPKIFIGYSDTTALQNAMYTQTGLVTYSGPAYSTLGQQSHLEYTIHYIQLCLFGDRSFNIEPSLEWLDDEWYLNDKSRTAVPNKGFTVIKDGEAAGTLFGGNLSTLRLLQGTSYLPNPEQGILFIEDDLESSYVEFDRMFESLTQAPIFNKIKGLLIGRFQNQSHITLEKLRRLVDVRKDRISFPVIANVDFGHTNPMITLPIGGEATMVANASDSTIVITAH